MQRTTLPLLACVLVFACNLNAQDVSIEIPGAAKPETKVQATELDDVLDSSSDVSKSPAGSVESADPVDTNNVSVSVDVAEGETGEAATDAPDTEGNESVDGGDVAEAGEASESEGDTIELDGEEDEEDGPVYVTVNENGQLVGQATATVSGEEVPIEANISLVRDGVLLSKIVADEDGSFSFPNVGPGDYNMYGSASSYCGQQPFTVLSGNSCDRCCDGVSLELSQYAQGGCYSGMAGAPAASFSGGVGGGLGGGGGFAGGGFAAGGGGAVGSGLSLLKVGGIATAIALGVSSGDDASPTE